MKWALLLLSVALLPQFCLSQTADLSLISLSVNVQPSSARDPLSGLDWSLSVSGAGSVQDPNGELRPSDPGVPYSHQSNFILVDPTTGEPIPFPFVLDLPDPGDSNTNGLADFFDVSVPIENLQTAGRHPTFDGKGADFSAKWARPAGQMSGTVLIDLPFFGLSFATTFSIPDYEGRLSFAVTPPTVLGTVKLTNFVTSADQIAGPLHLTITNNSQLGYDSGSWTNLNNDSYPFSPIDSLDQAGTNYVTFVQFADGNPATSPPDYQVWLLVIHSSDSNHNGVLDLVEKSSPPPPPELKITANGQSVQVTVLGISGQSYLLENSIALGANTWNTGPTFVLSGTSQTFEFSAQGRAKFFRVRETGPSGNANQ